MQTQEITIEIAYALPERQCIITLKTAANISVAEAIKASGILAKFPEIDLNSSKVGIFGKLVKLDAPMENLDRIEIYRPLIADPKEVRRMRAAKHK